jgi:hypothetical protein
MIKWGNGQLKTSIRFFIGTRIKRAYMADLAR